MNGSVPRLIVGSERGVSVFACPSVWLRLGSGPRRCETPSVLVAGAGCFAPAVGVRSLAPLGSLSPRPLGVPLAGGLCGCEPPLVAVVVLVVAVVVLVDEAAVELELASVGARCSPCAVELAPEQLLATQTGVFVTIGVFV